MNNSAHEHRRSEAQTGGVCCLTANEIEVLELLSDPSSNQVTFILRDGRPVRAIKERHVTIPEGPESDRTTVNAIQGLRYGSVTVSRQDGKTLSIAEHDSIRLSARMRE